MWLIFAGLGALLGAYSGVLMGAVMGGLIGHLLGRVLHLSARVTELERHLGRELARLQRSLPLDQPAQPTASPIPPATPSQEEQATALASHESALDTPLSLDLDRPAVSAEIGPQHQRPQVSKIESTWPTEARPTETWLSRLLAGNLLAKLGIILLFLGAASGLKLALEHGLFPPYLRLLITVLAGLTCIWAGAGAATGKPFRSAWLVHLSDMAPATRRGLGFALEGGGFALLYLSVYFALSFYRYLDPVVAFGLFAALGVACIALALRQEAQPLAVLGLSGAFLAPALAGGEGRHLVLFAYITLLDAFILWTSLQRGWRTLILIGFAFTVLSGMAWAGFGYHPGLRLPTTIFVILLFAMFSLTPVLAAYLGESVQWGWRSASLLFGPPSAAAVAQAALYVGELDILALSSLLAGLWYGFLWHAARRASEELLIQGLAGLAIAFISLAPFLALSQNVAGVFWALEGAALVWYAGRAHRRLPLAAGVLLQMLSGLLLWDLWLQSPDGVPFRQPLFYASLLLVVASALSLYAVRAWPLSRLFFLVWTLAWWFGTWYRELGQIPYTELRPAGMLLVAAFTCLVCDKAGQRWQLLELRLASLLLIPATLFVTLLIQWRTGHPLGDGLWLVLPVALYALYATLWQHERSGLHEWLDLHHVLLFWSVAWIPAWEIHWAAGQVAGPGSSVSEALRALLLAAMLLLVLSQHSPWPFGQHPDLYLRYGLAPVVLIAWAWLLSWPLALSGQWAMPYVPLLNPLELAAFFLLYVLYQHWQALGRPWRASGYPALFALALLLWLTAAIARTLHHWADAPYRAHALWQMDLFQALLSLAWTAFALAVLVLASHRQLRTTWFGGLVLLGIVGLKLLLVDLAELGGLLRAFSLIGIGLLVLGAGYLAPIPPGNRSQ